MPRHRRRPSTCNFLFFITVTPPMFSSTPLSCVSLTSLSSALRALTPTKLHHLQNMRYESGLTIVHRVSFHLATVNIVLSFLTISTLTFACPQIGMLIETHQCNNDDVRLKHGNTNVTLLLLLFSESYPPVPSCLATDLPVLHLRLYHVLPSLHLLPFQTRLTVRSFRTTLFVAVCVNSSTTPSSYRPLL